MQSYLDHVQIFIDYTNIAFYKNLMEFLGWHVLFEHTGVCGFRSEKNGDIWVQSAIKSGENDYDHVGVNHVSLRVGKKEDVDTVVDFLKKQNVAPLFDTPRERPEVASVVSSDTDTYYQIMFETPDKVLFEVVYIGAK
jgi:catechol 2,3-dioxygenase-like lactoylglutathione lyase family enzyme